ncbi:unnamed protein product, partial [Arabidopsis halleri]
GFSDYTNSNKIVAKYIITTVWRLKHVVAEPCVAKLICRITVAIWRLIGDHYLKSLFSRHTVAKFATLLATVL